jgi:hypothetical protein
VTNGFSPAILRVRNLRVDESTMKPTGICERDQFAYILLLRLL